ncbi:gamma-mobile-trio recombinase GmtY [Paraburkholderia sp. CNPSo 3272]|uniref:gamma-mobile-trio recombinase GmtY n=1 Tax=Paraburkholderia sp. CNPSo 3272 TaxID=2940931 RepID=UPI0020B6DA29|nr:gamma-mobile-trio recombinase GmtY [Paraburkholderia sp. CNPSo 3272]MCP3728371.1 gamma-mobile-trio recombinase GmtY [Paraburkholderia sp. CNPSo 3272]
MTLRREVARYHTVVHTLVRRTGRSDIRIYVLYVLTGEGGAPQAMQQLVEYVIEHGRTRSLAWQRDLARAVGLLVDFLHANVALFRSDPNRPQVLAAFGDALVSGTIDLGGSDPSGLYWEPKSVSRAKVILNAVTAFSDWLVNRYDTTALNPWRSAAVAEQIAYWRRFEKRGTHALLSHTMNRSDHVGAAKRVRTVQILRKTAVAHGSPPKTFPGTAMVDLITKGFALPGKDLALPWYERINVRDAMITILLHGGGLRQSEPFHLYVTDVAVDPLAPNRAMVRLFHPEQGVAPPDFLDPMTKKRLHGDREIYLRTKWQLEPRTLLHGRFHAGWKDLQLTDQSEKYALVHWFPGFWGEVFLFLFRIYITQNRSRRYAHPYLFVSHKDTVAGDPYTIDSFRQAHAKAVRRIGFAVGKDLGTTPHGHRHAYGQSLVSAGIDQKVVQYALHHKAIESQAPYTVPAPGAIDSVLGVAESRLRQSVSWNHEAFGEND